MRTKTKALTLALCAVLLVVTTVFATMAFLTSKDSVTNTFTVGNVAITMDEADVKTDGSYETDKDSRVDANVYHLIPGHTYIKDPTIHVNENSEACWVFAKIENGLGNAAALAMNSTENQTGYWTEIDETNHIWAYSVALNAGESSAALFETFTVDNNANVSEYQNAEIVVSGYAIQADGFATANAAWEAAGTQAQG